MGLRPRPVQVEGPLCRLQRHGPDRSLLGQQQDPPALSAWEPSDEPRHPHGNGHPDQPPPHQRGTHYDRKVAEGMSHKSAVRALKRRISDALYACMLADARQIVPQVEEGPGGQTGNDSIASVTGSHPEHRLFGKATPEPATTLRPPVVAVRSRRSKTPSRRVKKAS